VTRRLKLILRAYAITTKNQVIGNETVQRKQRKIFFVTLVQNDSSTENGLVLDVGK